MSSTICFNSDQSKILSSGNGLMFSNAQPLPQGLQNYELFHKGITHI